MALLDDSDPIVILTSQIHNLLDKHDSLTALGALASALGSFLDYAKNYYGETSPATRALREDLMQLLLETIHAREALRES